MPEVAGSGRAGSTREPGYRRAAWTGGVSDLGAVMTAGSLVAGLLGPVAIAVYAVLISLPAWIAGWSLARRN